MIFIFPLEDGGPWAAVNKKNNPGSPATRFGAVV